MGCGIRAGDVIENDFRIDKGLEKSINNNKFMEKINLDALNLHNKYREKHNSENLILSDNLCKKAQKKIFDLINGNDDKRDDLEEDNKLGENIYISLKDDVDVKKACEAWYVEGKLYDFNKNAYQRGTTHFTQMVWKGTKEIGFGYSQLKNGKSYFIALYFPSGNELFKFKENVEKRLDP